MTHEQFTQFLVIYDVRAGKVEIRDLGDDVDAAAAAYAEAESIFSDASQYEVVLIGADSLETIQTTHAHYFERERDGLSLRSRLRATAFAA